MRSQGVQQAHHALDHLDRSLGIRVRIAHWEKSVDATNSGKLIVYRIVKKANVVRGGIRISLDARRAARSVALALVLFGKQRIIRDVYPEERPCESDCSLPA